MTNGTDSDSVPVADPTPGGDGDGTRWPTWSDISRLHHIPSATAGEAETSSAPAWPASFSSVATAYEVYADPHDNCVKGSNVHRLLIPIPTRAGKIQIALAKGVTIRNKSRFAIRGILFVNLGDVVERQLVRDGVKLPDHATCPWQVDLGFPVVIDRESHLSCGGDVLDGRRGIPPRAEFYPLSGGRRMGQKISGKILPRLVANSERVARLSLWNGRPKARR